MIYCIWVMNMASRYKFSEEDYKLQENAIKDDAAFQQEIMGAILDDNVEFGIIK